MDYHGAIKQYYNAFRDRDLACLRSLLTPDFHFVSSFGEGPELIVVYEHENAPGVGRPRMRMAEYVRFQGEQIAEIEVFAGRLLETQEP